MSKDAKENPFLPAKKKKKDETMEAPAAPPAPPATDPEDVEAYLLGQPVTSFRPDEKEFIDEQMAQFLSVMKKNPGAKVFVTEIILTSVEMQRHDANVMRQRAVWGAAKLTEENTQWLLRMAKVRDSLLTRHTAALEAIGALPKDAMMRDAEPDECMADVHRKYAAELKARRASGQGVGRPTDDALKLAASKGHDPARYRAEPLPESVHEEVIVEIESDV